MKNEFSDFLINNTNNEDKSIINLNKKNSNITIKEFSYKLTSPLLHNKSDTFNSSLTNNLDLNISPLKRLNFNNNVNNDNIVDDNSFFEFKRKKSDNFFYLNNNFNEIKINNNEENLFKNNKISLENPFNNINNCNNAVYDNKNCNNLFDLSNLKNDLFLNKSKSFNNENSKFQSSYNDFNNFNKINYEVEDEFIINENKRNINNFSTFNNFEQINTNNFDNNTFEGNKYDYEEEYKDLSAKNILNKYASQMINFENHNYFIELDSNENNKGKNNDFNNNYIKNKNKDEIKSVKNVFSTNTSIINSKNNLSFSSNNNNNEILIELKNNEKNIESLNIEKIIKNKKTISEDHSQTNNKKSTSSILDKLITNKIKKHSDLTFNPNSAVIPTVRLNYDDLSSISNNIKPFDISLPLTSDMEKNTISNKSDNILNLNEIYNTEICSKIKRKDRFSLSTISEEKLKIEKSSHLNNYLKSTNFKALDSNNKTTYNNYHSSAEITKKKLINNDIVISKKKKTSFKPGKLLFYMSKEPNSSNNKENTDDINEKNSYISNSLKENKENLKNNNNNVIESNQTPNKTPCSCKNTKCLKLYCECFANQRYCVGCNCVNCFNIPKFEDVKKKAINYLQKRNKTAFMSKVVVAEDLNNKNLKEAQNSTDNVNIKIVSDNSNNASKLIHHKGCRCKNSSCLKNYCECFQLGVPCSDLCQCSNCKNCKDLEGEFSLKRINNYNKLKNNA